MLTLKNQIIQEKISTLTNTYPFILIFHSNTIKAKQWIDFRKTLHLKNIKIPCKNLPIRFFSRKYTLKETSTKSIYNEYNKPIDEISTKSSNSISNKFLNNMESLGGPSCFFFCQTTKEIQDTLKIMKELSEVFERSSPLPSFLSVGMLIREHGHSTFDISIKPSQTKFIDGFALSEALSPTQVKPSDYANQHNYKFLSFYDIEQFIELNPSIFIKVINLLTANNQIHLNINSFIKTNTQLLLSNHINLLQLIQYHINRSKNK